MLIWNHDFMTREMDILLYSSRALFTYYRVNTRFSPRAIGYPENP